MKLSIAISSWPCDIFSSTNEHISSMLFIRKNMTSPHNTFDWKSYGHELHTHSTDIPLKALMILYYTTLIFLGQICLRGEGAMRLTLCEAPTCETRPDHYSGNSVPYSLQQVSGFFNVPCWLYNTEDAGDGAYNFRPDPRRLEYLTICRCHCKGSMFSSVILRPWVLVWSGAQTRDLLHSSFNSLETC